MKTAIMLKRCPILVLLSFLIIIPLSAGYIDCRISCRRCHENTEHPSVLEVYCAMCEECKQRRRERMRDSTEDSADSLAKAMMSPAPVGNQQAIDQNQEREEPTSPAQHAASAVLSHPALGAHPARASQLQGAAGSRQAGRQALIYGWPQGCPTPPLCSESEEEIIHYLVNPSPTSTTTRPTQPPCPPVMQCRKKRKTVVMTTPAQMPCMPCMPMCPCPGFNGGYNMYAQSSQPPPPPHQYQPPTTTHIDYQYLYIGLPKNILRLKQS